MAVTTRVSSSVTTGAPGGSTAPRSCRRAVTSPPAGAVIVHSSTASWARRSSLSATLTPARATSICAFCALAEQKRAQLAVDECTIVAPIAGAVTARLHEPGAVLPPAAPVITLLDIGTVTATFFLPESELGRVEPGMPAELHVDAYPDRVFEGKVRRIAAEAEFTPRNVQTREDRDRLVYAVDVDVPNPDGTLRAGMPGDVILPGTGR